MARYLGIATRRQRIKISCTKNPNQDVDLVNLSFFRKPVMTGIDLVIFLNFSFNFDILHQIKKSICALIISEQLDYVHCAFAQIGKRLELRLKLSTELLLSSDKSW